MKTITLLVNYAIIAVTILLEVRMQKVRLLVSGRVQGVGFRFFTYTTAITIGDIYGRVWNNDDGTVEIHAQSPFPQNLSQFIHQIRKGNAFSKVTYVDVVLAHFPDYDSFKMS